MVATRRFEMTVLVAVASKHGATTEIAEAIARSLEEHGRPAVVRPLDEIGSIEGYEGVVVGSAVYAGSWLKEAREFVDHHAGELAAVPTWLFSSGPLGDPPLPEAAKAVKVDGIVAGSGAREHRLFAGALDRHELGLAERAVLRLVRAEEGDHRDWEAVRAYGAEIALQLTDGAVTVDRER
jgi:menaquinone-dependent protoporphyrinogen oxidase